ncbi:uncharacterized protein [Antedon mediterranea]|uniref:uncharacterized protein n=1 Tax=Antedon mediterranea TaxID=105859 RepID=UPI003AF46EE8
MNLFNIIRSKYGQDTVKLVRAQEKIVRKAARTRHHRVFALHCKRLNITPKGLQLKCPINPSNAEKIIKDAENRLVRESIRKSTKSIKVLKRQEKEIEQRLDESFNDVRNNNNNRPKPIGVNPSSHVVRGNTRKHLNNVRESEFARVKARQIKKLKWWRQSKENKYKFTNGNRFKWKIVERKWVVNLSSRPLSSDEQNVLSKGLNYAVSGDRNKSRSIEEIIVSTEMICKLDSIPLDEKDTIRGKVTSILKSSKPPLPNLSRTERNAFEGLKKDKEVMILPADKGRATVVINTEDYIYEQHEGIAMGSPVSHLIANIYLESFEEEAIKSADGTIKRHFWRRYVDDVFAIVHKDAPLPLNRHLDSIDPSGKIKFTTEIMSEKQITFLDMIIRIKQDGTLATKVYRKPTHTDQYLDFHSNHPLEHKLSVVNTLVDRANTIVSEEEDKKQELKHIRKALKICNYPKWSVDRVVSKRKEQNSKTSQKNVKERKWRR